MTPADAVEEDVWTDEDDEAYQDAVDAVVEEQVELLRRLVEEVEAATAHITPEYIQQKLFDLKFRVMVEEQLTWW